jgi:MYXO-CTERM domain-containing protein
MSRRPSVRRAFVAVVAASTATVGLAVDAGEAAANPPAPSSVPDPSGLIPAGGQHPTRIKRHDGGCYVYTNDGPIAKTDCPSFMDKAGESVELEADLGICVFVEPWGDEPREIPCPPALGGPRTVDAGPKLASVGGGPAVTTEPARARGCGGCATAPSGPSAGAFAALAAIAGVAIRRRRR